MQWLDDTWQKMLVIPTQAGKNSYVPPPWVVCHSIFGLFVLEDWQIDLHSKTPSSLCGSFAFSWCCHYGWMLGISQIGTLTHWREWTTRGVSRKVWSSLPSVPSTTLTSILRVSIFPLRPVINHITPSHLPFRSVLFHAFHPLWYHMQQMGSLLPPSFLLGGILAPIAFIIFSTTAYTMASEPSCAVFMVASPWAVLLAQLMVHIKLNPTSLAFPKGNPSLHVHRPKNRIASSEASTPLLVICSSRPSWSISTINEPLHVREGGGWLPPPSPKSL